MTQNSNEAGMLGASRLREKSARGGAAPIVGHASDNAHEGDGLFPGTPAPLTARPLVLITRGRIEYTAKCPGCGQWHRHRKLGDVEGPCGTTYELQPKAKRRAA